MTQQPDLFADLPPDGGDPQAQGAPRHPNLIDRERQVRSDVRGRDDWRLVLVIAAFCLAYATVGVRMGMMALSEPEEPRLSRSDHGSKPVRGEITDRNGMLLASNLPAWSLYARPRQLKDPAGTAADLARILDLDQARVLESFAEQTDFVWVKRPITPRQKAEIRDLGRPGLHFGARDARVYPAGQAVAHIVGAVRPAQEGVQFAEYMGTAGAERAFDGRLRGPDSAGQPLRLTIDLAAQTALTDVLSAGLRRFDARAGSAVLMDVDTGEIVALASLPGFDPNHRPTRGPGEGREDPRFNRAVQGLYELGSVFKPITAAIALESGMAAPDSLIETGEPYQYGRRRIRDSHKMPDLMTVTDIIVRSSNVGVAKLAMRVGTSRFEEYLRRLGMLDVTGLELPEAAAAKPLLPRKWTDLSTITMSYGYGLSVSPVHMAAAYATLANGGRVITPTVLMGARRDPGQRVFSERVSRQVLDMLRDTVRRGTGKRADVTGYEVGGKTGTAEKARPASEGGGYDRERVIATFASVFPTSAPRYALVVSLDEPVDREGRRPVREASRTAVPVAGEAIRRLAPILGLPPLPLATEPARPALTAMFDEAVRGN